MNCTRVNLFNSPFNIISTYKSTPTSQAGNEIMVSLVCTKDFRTRASSDWSGHCFHTHYNMLEFTNPSINCIIYINRFIQATIHNCSRIFLSLTLYNDFNVNLCAYFFTQEICNQDRRPHYHISHISFHIATFIFRIIVI